MSMTQQDYISHLSNVVTLLETNIEELQAQKEAVQAVIDDIKASLPPPPPPVPLPTAAFTVSASSGIAPFSVSVTFAGANADSVSWDFGDGGTGTGTTASHTYQAAGTFTITCTASNATGSAQSTASVQATAPVPPPNPNPAPSPSPVPALTVSSVVPNHNSAKVFISPVDGAADYRVYDKADPHTVKYAGGAGYSAIVAYQPKYGQPLQKPDPCVEWNGIPPSSTVTLVVEAVDALGPYMDMHGAAMSACTEVGCTGVDDPDCACVESINGHGDPAAKPKLLARAEIQVTTVARVLTGAQAFLDTFDDEQQFTKAAIDPRSLGIITPADYQRYENPRWFADVFKAGDRASEVMVFTHKRHLMSVLADGGKTWWTDPATGIKYFVGGQAYATIALKPKTSWDISGGKVLHITGELDAHNGGRNWEDFLIMPKGDCIYQNAWHVLNLNPFLSKTGLAFHIGHDVVDIRQFDATHGQDGYKDSNGNFINEKWTGSFLKWPDYQAAWSENFWRCTPNAAGTADAGHNSWANGHDNDNDNRHRFDLYISSTQARLYEEGLLRADWTFPVALSFSQMEVCFLQHLYHSNLRQQELRTNYVEAELLWRDRTPYTDQKHWNCLGGHVIDALP